MKNKILPLSLAVFLCGLCSSVFAADTEQFIPGKTYRIDVVVGSGLQPFTYQWKRNGGDILDAKESFYIATMPGIYSVVVTNSIGSTRSDDAVLVPPAPPAKGSTQITPIEEPAPAPAPAPSPATP